MQDKINKNDDQNASKKTFLEWIKEHVRPQVGYEDKPEEGNECQGFGSVWKNVKERIRIGIGFRFRF